MNALGRTESAQESQQERAGSEKTEFGRAASRGLSGLNTTFWQATPLLDGSLGHGLLATWTRSQIIRSSSVQHRQQIAVKEE